VKLNIGCGRNIKPAPWINLDSREGPGVDLVFDVEMCAEGAELPFHGNECEEFLLSHVLEHVSKPLPLMQELHRVAMPGAGLIVVCPYGSSNDADEDPTHVRRLYEGSFGYFGQPFYWRADYGYRGDWMVERLILKLQPWCNAQQHTAIRTQRNMVREMVAVLRAVKPIREPRQELQTSFTVELTPP
jgi:hypothetical protein